MKQQDIFKILAGASQVAKNSGKIIASSSTNFIEQNIIKGKYVSREEHEELKRVVLNLEQKLAALTGEK
jgi:hypothetical protein